MLNLRAGDASVLLYDSIPFNITESVWKDHRVLGIVAVIGNQQQVSLEGGYRAVYARKAMLPSSKE